MTVEIINIGDELLIGQVVNTNASWMAEQLSMGGFSVARVTVISDSRGDILQALSEAGGRARIVLISGGIGPTKDDITKHTLCEFFSTRLAFNQEAYDDVEALFARRGFAMTELNRQQAELPENCTGVPNRLGTARGMWFEKKQPGGETTIYVSMPGVPFEMKEMMSLYVIPWLKKKFDTPFILHRTVLTQGVGESFLAEQIAAWEDSLPAYIRLAYLPQPGIVRLRLSATGTDQDKLLLEVEEEVAKLKEIIPGFIFGYDDETLEGITGRMLVEKKATLAVAESCTGGYIAHLVTSVPGSSAYFKGSVVAYSNDIKEKILGVDPALIRQFGAVSAEVVTAMAMGLKERFQADYVIATSGIAGPDGGTPEKPVGTTWIAIAALGEVVASCYLFGDSRERNIRRAALQALNLLRKKMLTMLH